MKSIYRIALDIDNTISADPEFFSVLSHAFLAAGHEVYIVTATYEEEEPARIKYVESLGIVFTKFISTNSLNKYDACIKHGINMAIDDIPQIYGLLYSNVPFKFIKIHNHER